jgi:hypothetical protein
MFAAAFQVAIVMLMVTVALVGGGKTDLADAQRAWFLEHFTYYLPRRLHTPRMCKRYVNAIAFALVLSAGELNTVDHLVVEGLRLCYPALYEFTLDHREVALGEPP